MPCIHCANAWRIRGHIYIYIYIYIYMSAYIYICPRVYIYIYADIYIYVYIYIYRYMFVRVHVCVRSVCSACLACTYICAYICMSYRYVYMCLYLRTYVRIYMTGMHTHAMHPSSLRFKIPMDLHSLNRPQVRSSMIQDLLDNPRGDAPLCSFGGGRRLQDALLVRAICECLHEATQNMPEAESRHFIAASRSSIDAYASR